MILKFPINVERQLKKLLLRKRQITHQFSKTIFWDHNHNCTQKKKHPWTEI
jgi:hypothetical protein